LAWPSRNKRGVQHSNQSVENDGRSAYSDISTDTMKSHENGSDLDDVSASTYVGVRFTIKPGNAW
jgi:hypothetical protein